MGFQNRVGTVLALVSGMKTLSNKILCMRIILGLVVGMIVPKVSHALLTENLTLATACAKPEQYTVRIGTLESSVQINPMVLSDARGNVLAVIGRTQINFVTDSGEVFSFITLADKNTQVSGFPLPEEIKEKTYYLAVYNAKTKEVLKGMTELRKVYDQFRVVSSEFLDFESVVNEKPCELLGE